jgi:hypothetical protein
MLTESPRRGGDEVSSDVFPCTFISGTWNVNIKTPELGWGYDGSVQLTMLPDCSNVAAAVLNVPRWWTGESVSITLQETSARAYQPANRGLGAYYDIWILTLYGYTPNYSAELVMLFNTGSFAFGTVAGTASLWSYGSKPVAQYNGTITGTKAK